jgi:adenine phosphoribosyltransferase
MGNYSVKLSDKLTVSLPLVKVSDELSIYSFNMMGKAEWNHEAAKSIARIILHDRPADFDVIITAESKAIALTEQLATFFVMDRYVVLRKGVKAYMEDPIEIETKSITTAGAQRLYLDKSDRELVEGRKALVVDDVISTGGTMDAIFKMAEKGNFGISLIACVLTEGERRRDYNGVRVVSLDHIPLP